MVGEERVEPLPRALHRTQSIFLKNLPALITRQEIEEVEFSLLLCFYRGYMFAELSLQYTGMTTI